MMDGIGAFLFVYLLVAALLLFAVVAGAILLVRALAKPAPDGQGASALVEARKAFDILEERYARGEIDDDEFERRRRALGRNAP
jgi:putative membrane protein